MVKQNSLYKKNSPILLSFSLGNIMELVGSLSLEIENVRLFTAHATVALRHHFKEKKKYLCCVFFLKLYNSNEVTFVH